MKKADVQLRHDATFEASLSVTCPTLFLQLEQHSQTLADVGVFFGMVPKYTQLNEAMRKS